MIKQSPDQFNYATGCSGIEAPSVAWKDLEGWNHVWFSQYDPEHDYKKGPDFASKVLKHHYPSIPNLGDMTKVYEKEEFKQPIDLFIAGTPCTEFSVAGLRGGIHTYSGNLAIEYCRILITKQPRWFIWENVPGIFSSFSDEEESKIYGGNGGYDCTQTADFAALLQGFRECGYCCAYRILNSEYWGLPQARNRVFVVGYLGENWRPPTTVLFESKSMRWDSKKSGKERAGVAKNIKNGVGEDSGQIIDYFRMSAFGEYENDGTASTLKKRDYKDATDLIVAYDLQQIAGKECRSNPKIGDPSPTISKGNAHNIGIVNGSLTIRKLTPLEAERLMGFPDYYTKIPGSKDSDQYQVLGNSMPVNVIRWIGQRIKLVDRIIKETAIG